jgi:tetratricopeptide (TPR) repeat protein
VEWVLLTKPKEVEIPGVNHMKIEDDIYKSVHIKPDDAAKEIVPVEESLLLNSAGKRRKLLLDVLSLGAADYVPSLRLAGKNEDTEVVHYAVTALVELRKEYDQRMEEMDRKMENSRRTGELIREYIALDEEYIKTTLPEGEDRNAAYRHYDQLLAEAMRDSRDAEERAEFLRKRVECALALREYNHAGELIEELIALEPEQENGYLLKIFCCSALKDRKGIDRAIRKLVTNHVPLSEEGKKRIAFWQPAEDMLERI